ncbi:MAG: hypothetical protein HN509_03895, partial [Halobacteriovoraceae bacterium]|nr:hypothetical protein [Halobacteriovoraceae bacterium]
LIAGTIGVGFDQLRQRELQRKQRQQFFMSVAAVLLISVLSSLSWWALEEKSKAQERLITQIRKEGVELMDSGDYGGALLLFAESLKLKSDIGDDTSNERIRIASLIQATPKLVKLFKHTGPVRNAVFSEDGKFLLTVEKPVDKKKPQILRRFELATKKVLNRLETKAEFRIGPKGNYALEYSNRGAVRLHSFSAVKQGTPPEFDSYNDDGIIFHTDGLKFIISKKKEVQYISTETGLEFGKSIGHKERIESAIFSRSGKFLALAESDNGVRVFDSVTMKQVGKTIDRKKSVKGLALSDDGKILAGNDSGGWIANVETGELISKKLVDFRINHVKFSPDGVYLMVIGSQYTKAGLALFSPATGKLVGDIRYQQGFYISSDFTRDSSLMVTGSTNSMAQIYDLATPNSVAIPLYHKGYVKSVAFSNDGKLLATASTDKWVRIFSLPQKNTVMLQLPSQTHFIVNAKFNPSGDRIYGAGLSLKPGENKKKAKGWLGLWDSKNGKLIKTVDHPVTPRKGMLEIGEVTASGNFYTHGTAASVYQYDPDLLQVGHQYKHKKTVVDTTHLKKTGKMWSIGRDRQLKLWELATGENLSTVELKGRRFILAISGNESVLATTSYRYSGRQIVIRNAQTGKTIHKIELGEKSCLGLALDQSGENLIAMINEQRGDEFINTVQVWNILQGKWIGKNIRYPEALTSIALSRDDERILTAGHDFTARLHDLKSGRSLSRPMKHSESLRGAKFSKSGKFIVTKTESGNFFLWDAHNGSPLAPAFVAKNVVSHIDFHPTSLKILATNIGRSSGLSRIWNIEKSLESPEEISKKALWLSGRKLEETGEFTTLDPEKMKKYLKEP